MSDSAVKGSDFLAAAAAGDLAILQQGLDAGLKADTTDEYGNSALMMASARGQRDAARLLLSAGADRDHKNRYGYGPRQWVTWAHNRDEITSLLS